MGELGTTPAELETRLTAVLDLCSKWDALVRNLLPSIHSFIH